MVWNTKRREVSAIFQKYLQKCTPAVHSLRKYSPPPRKFISTVFDPKESNRTSNAAAENPPSFFFSPSISVCSLHQLDEFDKCPLQSVKTVEKNIRPLRLLTNLPVCQTLFLSLIQLEMEVSRYNAKLVPAIAFFSQFEES